jgi:hypothetical protein
MEQRGPKFIALAWPTPATVAVLMVLALTLCGPTHLLYCDASPKVAKAKYWIIYISDICSETVGDSNMQQFLPWPPWAARQEIEMILIAKVSKESNIELRYRRHFRIQTSPM